MLNAVHFENQSPLIDGLIPNPDVVKSHEIAIDAPPDVVLDIAEHFDLQSIPTIRLLFRLREFILHIRHKPRPKVKFLVSETMNLGWIRLAYDPGRQLVMGAVAQPWIGDVEFKPVNPAEFSSFAEPGFVKIVWTLEAEPLRHRTTLFRTETRVSATDAASRKRFLLYWTFAGGFVSLIRVLGIRAIKREAERRLV